MILTNVEKYRMHHGVLAANQDLIHIKRDLIGSDNKRSRHWYAKYYELKTAIDLKVAGNPITFNSQTRKYERYHR